MKQFLGFTIDADPPVHVSREREGGFRCVSCGETFATPVSRKRNVIIDDELGRYVRTVTEVVLDKACFYCGSSNVVSNKRN